MTGPRDEYAEAETRWKLIGQTLAESGWVLLSVGGPVNPWTLPVTGPVDPEPPLNPCFNWTRDPWTRDPGPSDVTQVRFTHSYPLLLHPYCTQTLNSLTH